MVYKRPSDFIPRKPLRSSDDDDSMDMSSLLSSLPQETKARKAPDQIQPLDGLFSESSTSVGRWASSSSLDYYHHSEDEEVTTRKGRRRVKFDSVEVQEIAPKSKQEQTSEEFAVEKEAVLDFFISTVDDYEACKSDPSSQPKRLSPEDREQRTHQPDSPPSSPSSA
eukprot:CAMPEP_0168742106 /NCGR_PEP_ID=MMETSP0724-20121128/12865_1 /TAXON_ID=265536 /ORGANISM="Amphiprora sp., Strain CCMP467" /LENGTH=166 /DNA_ID=CAMNT_0008789645 /DNA_START=68 /DNA_END=568 /DNA_ORIENTATION=+